LPKGRSAPATRRLRANKENTEFLVSLLRGLDGCFVRVTVFEPSNLLEMAAIDM
jgi:hypothetical protein